MKAERAYAPAMAHENRIPRKRPREPIGPTTIPGEPTDPKIPPDEAPERDNERNDADYRGETEEERQARESEKAFDQAFTRIPPG